jgi:molybdopterin converting factor small subunit
VKIKVKLFAGLRDFLPPGAAEEEAQLDLAPGATVSEALKLFSFPEGIRLITLVNSTPAHSYQVLHEGDTLAVFPPLAGG